MWWGDSTGGENNWFFLATVGDRNPPVGKILTCTLKNHNLFFIIKHFESILGIIKNIWLWISKNILLSTNFRKILRWAIFRKSANNDLVSCNNMNKFSETEILLFFFIHKSQLRHVRKVHYSYVQCVWWQHNQFEL